MDRAQLIVAPVEPGPYVPYPLTLLSLLLSCCSLYSS